MEKTRRWNVHSKTSVSTLYYYVSNVWWCLNTNRFWELHTWLLSSSQFSIVILSFIYSCFLLDQYHHLLCVFFKGQQDGFLFPYFGLEKEKLIFKREILALLHITFFSRYIWKWMAYILTNLFCFAFVYFLKFSILSIFKLFFRFVQFWLF